MVKKISVEPKFKHEYCANCHFLGRDEYQTSKSKIEEVDVYICFNQNKGVIGYYTMIARYGNASDNYISFPHFVKDDHYQWQKNARIRAQLKGYKI